MISGLSASVERQLDGSLRIGGVSVADPERPANGNNEFAEWLFQQERIAIEDSAIEWRDLKHQQDPMQLNEVALSMRADREGRSQMTGSAKLPGKYGGRIRFAFDARGDLWSPDWSGELHVAATEINPGPLDRSIPDGQNQPGWRQRGSGGVEQLGKRRAPRLAGTPGV